MQNLQRVGKNSPPIWSRLWAKFHAILRRCRRPLVVCNALARRISLLQLPFSCKIVKKGGFAPWFVGGRDTSHFRHAFSNRTYFRPCGQIWLSSIQRASRVADEKRRKKEKSLVKHKSADMYVGWPKILKLVLLLQQPCHQHCCDYRTLILCQTSGHATLSTSYSRWPKHLGNISVI